MSNATVVGADAYIGPVECTAFMEISGEFAAAQWADVGIGPYRETSKCVQFFKEHTMTIKDVETQTGLARANIRYYEAEGLIAPERAENGYREYSQEDAEILLRVKLLRALGLTVGQIKALVHGETSLDAALEDRLRRIRQEAAVLNRAGEVAEQLWQAHTQFQTLDAKRYLDQLQSVRPIEQDMLPKDHFPWQRLFARLLDSQIYRTLWVLVLPLLGFNILKNSMGGRTFLWFLSLLTMFLLEPPLLSLFCTTPGKWLFGLRVTDPDGRKLTYAAGRERIAYLLWYGLRLDLPIFRLFRLYVSYSDEQQGRELPWEDGSEQTIRDHTGWRFAAAAALMVLLIAVGVLRVLLPVGPVHRGNLTVAQFAENYNAIQIQLGETDLALDTDGRWHDETSYYTSLNGEATITHLYNDRYPQFEYETENGILEKIIYHSSGNDIVAWQSVPSEHVMQYAMFAFVGAEKGHILLDKPLLDAASALVENRFAEYHTVVDGVAVDYTYFDTWSDSMQTQYSYTLTLTKVQK